MRIGPVWTFVLMFSAAGCESPGTFQGADDRAEVDQDPGEREAAVLPIPQVGSYPDLGRKLASILESIESARAVLRQDSGTLAADSALIRFRYELRDRLAEVMADLNDRQFQADVWPAGAAAMGRWREEQREERRPTPEEEARADSILAVLEAYGVWAQRAEGDTYFAPDEAVLLQSLGPYLTHGLRDFLGMQVDEQRRPVAGDAALMIPLDELTHRIRWAERYLDTHTESLVLDVVESRYRWYLAIYLAGLPNTPAFEWRTGELKAQWRESMNQYAAAYGSTASGQLVSRYLGLLEASNFTRNAELDAFLSELWANIRLVRFP